MASEKLRPRLSVILVKFYAVPKRFQKSRLNVVLDYAVGVCLGVLIKLFCKIVKTSGITPYREILEP